MKRRTQIALSTVGALAVIAALGPRVHAEPLQVPPSLPEVPQSPEELQAWVDQGEQAVAGIRPDNHARIVWSNPARPARTAYAMVYLHGFSASQGEGEPIHRQLAETFGCNLYLARLPGHGLEAPDAMRGLTAQQLFDASAQALAIGQALGDNVILIGSSTGGALSLALAAHYPRAVDALVLWSPLIHERANALAPLTWPWGASWLVHARNHGSPIMHGHSDSVYWSADNHLDGYRSLTELTRAEMVPATFRKIHAPLFLGYYFRDEQHQDPTVSVAAMLTMYKQLGTDKAHKRKQSFPEAGAHVIASPLRSQTSAQVFTATRDFLQRVLGLELTPHA